MPGIQPKAVNSKLIRKVTPRPCFIKTAKGGNKIFKMIVNIIIFLIGYFYRNYIEIQVIQLDLTGSWYGFNKISCFEFSVSGQHKYVYTIANQTCSN